MAAKRTCGDDSLAADASQLVFILLAQRAKSLTSHPALAGWLHVTAVMKTRDLIDKARREFRKRQHLSAAMENNSSAPSGDALAQNNDVADMLELKDLPLRLLVVLERSVPIQVVLVDVRHDRHVRRPRVQPPQHEARQLQHDPRLRIQPLDPSRQRNSLPHKAKVSPPTPACVVPRRPHP